RTHGKHPRPTRAVHIPDGLLKLADALEREGLFHVVRRVVTDVLRDARHVEHRVHTLAAHHLLGRRQDDTRPLVRVVVAGQRRGGSIVFLLLRSRGGRSILLRRLCRRGGGLLLLLGGRIRRGRRSRPLWTRPRLGV